MTNGFQLTVNGLQLTVNRVQKQKIKTGHVYPFPFPKNRIIQKQDD